MIENRHLRYFLEVARLLHMTRAAEKLHIAQPALTQNIQQLESEWGVSLFHRNGHRLSLTEAGQVLVREAEHSLGVFQATQLSVQRAARGEAGTLALGFQSTAGILVIPRLIQRFRAAHPQVEIMLREMGTSAQRKALRAGELDAAIIYARPEDEFAAQDLTPEPLVAALPSDHPLAERESVAFKDLKDEVFVIASREIAETLYNSILAECADNGFQPKAVQDISTAQTGLGLVAAKAGVAVMPSSIRVLAREGVVLKTIRDTRIQARLTMLWPKKYPSPIVSRLLEFLE
jgi:DNA-binding transcriptional LysR family regulator